MTSVAAVVGGRHRCYIEIDPRKALGRHADHRVHVGSQLQRLAQHRTVPAESTHPKLPAQHRDMRAASHTVFVSAEKAPQLRTDAEEGEERSRDQARLDELRLGSES